MTMCFEKLTKERKEKLPEIPGTSYWIKKHKEKIYKKAAEIQSEYEFNSNGKIPAIENAFSDPLAKKVAYMIATSHEYKKPNVKAALSFTKNYKWELSSAKTIDLQGINKPIIPEKVDSMAKQMKGKAPKPLICVNQFHGIRPQTPGKKILMDGHHRLEACKVLNVGEVPIYKGTYTGAAEKPYSELKEKTAGYKEQIYKMASQRKEDPYRATKTTAIMGALGVPTDFAFDAVSESWDIYKRGRRRYGSNLKKIFTSPNAKRSYGALMRKQKGFAIPVSAALAALPILPVYLSDRKRAQKMAEYKDGIEKVAKAKSDFQKLKDNKVPLTPEERRQCLNAKAVWHFNGGNPSPAVWKSVDKDGKVTYITNTHRAYNTAPTLKGAIGRFHKFIKSTA